MSRIRQVFGRDFIAIHEASVGHMVVQRNLWRSLPANNEGPEGYRQAAFRLRNDRSVNSAANLMSCWRARPPRPQLESLSAFSETALHAAAAEQHRDAPLDARSEALAVLELTALLISPRSGVLVPPRCGMHTTLTPSCLHDATLCSLKNPRSPPYKSGAWPKACCAF